MKHAAGLAYRDAGDPSDRAVLLLHGYPESSYMWRHALPAIAGAGFYAVAPDLPGYGDSEPGESGAAEDHIEAVDRFVNELGLGDFVLVTHDWGVWIGLWWACDHPGANSALVISDGGFFSDRRWHAVANVMRTPGEGEKLVEGYTKEAFFNLLKQVSSGMTDDALEEYWKGFDGDVRRRAHLELYRSGDFEKLARYDGRLAELGLPTLVMWGAEDGFAGVKMAHRFHDDIEGSELVVFDDAGHFVWEDEPQRSTEALVDFLRRRL